MQNVLSPVDWKEIGQLNPAVLIEPGLLPELPRLRRAERWVESGLFEEAVSLVYWPIQQRPVMVKDHDMLTVDSGHLRRYFKEVGKRHGASIVLSDQ